jgi:RNA polymerase sigma-70 factor, ECF subfamily
MGGRVASEVGHLRDVHDLVAAAQAGDSYALEDLLRRLRPAVLKYCRARLVSYSGGREAADDAAQETCLAICRIVPRFRDQGAPFIAMVFAIASNKVADAQRRFARSADLVDEIPEQVEPSPGPEDTVMSSARLAAAKQLVDRLPDKMRHVLLLRASGVNADQVGEQLGMTAGAVRVTHHRAVARLRKLLAESDDPDLLAQPTQLAAAS